MNLRRTKSAKSHELAHLVVLCVYLNFRFKVNEKAKKEKTAAKLGKDSDRNKATPKHEVRHQQAKTDEKKNNSSVNKRKSQLKSKDSTNKTAPARLNASADSVLTDTSVASESSLDQTGLFYFQINLKKQQVRARFGKGQNWHCKQKFCNSCSQSSFFQNVVSFCYQM